MDPKEPESFFKMYKALHKQADETRTSLVKEAKDNYIDSFKFFGEINQRQMKLTKVQKELHERVLNIESQWTNAQSMTDSHRQYKTAVKFFQQNEEQIKAMTDEMQKLTKDVASLPK